LSHFNGDVIAEKNATLTYTTPLLGRQNKSWILQTPSLPTPLFWKVKGLSSWD